MRISEVLRRKGDRVVTVSAYATVGELLGMLAEHGVGALVVSSDGEHVEGIVSERDVVRRMHADGPSLLEQPVERIMTSDVHTCEPSATVNELMVVMTEQRVRHIPVLRDGRLAGIVSIGDVVKHRITELTEERDQLEAYISR